MMRSPSIVPSFNSDVYIVLDDYGPIGRAYRETDERESDRGTILRYLKDGQYNNPVRIVAFNTAEGWSRDVTTEFAQEIKDQADRFGEDCRPVSEISLRKSWKGRSGSQKSC
jgi:hypothetical protein